jgi:hypothetical protein
MRKILLGLFVVMLGVAFVVPGLAKKNDVSNSVETEVVWTVPSFIELSVSEDNFTFPEFDPGIDEYLAEDAVILYVSSNSDWSLTYELDGDAEAIAHLEVILSQDSGNGNATVSVDYLLAGLRDMAPGTYEVTVVYTATAE